MCVAKASPQPPVAVEKKKTVLHGTRPSQASRLRTLLLVGGSAGVGADVERVGLERGTLRGRDKASCTPVPLPTPCCISAARSQSHRLSANRHGSPTPTPFPPSPDPSGLPRQADKTGKPIERIGF